MNSFLGSFNREPMFAARENKFPILFHILCIKLASAFDVPRNTTRYFEKMFHSRSEEEETTLQTNKNVTRKIKFNGRNFHLQTFHRAMIAKPTFVDILSSQNYRNINSLRCLHKEMRRE